MKDKEQTKRKILWAVAEIARLEGFDALNASKVARKAEVDRKLITRYFGGLQDLKEAYVTENDYWLSFTDHINDMLKSNSYPGSKELITSVLQNQFNYFLEEKNMQRMILWELTHKSNLMRSIHNARESMGQKFLELTDPHFKGSNVNFRAVSALLVGGIYYTILHTIYNGGTFTDLDLSTDAGQQEIIKAIQQIVGWAYQDANLS